MRTTRSVSIEGDRILLDALKKLASDKETTVGELVATAVNNVYGVELAPILSFFRSSDYPNIQSDKVVDHA